MNVTGVAAALAMQLTCSRIDTLATPPMVCRLLDAPVAASGGSVTLPAPLMTAAPVSAHATVAVALSLMTTIVQ